MVFLLFFLAMSTAFSQPETREEARAFDEYARKNLELGVDGRTHYEELSQKLLIEMKTSGETRAGVSSLAHAFHMLGHYAEGAHEFEKALEYNRASLTWDQKINAPIEGSWRAEHALEHLFMNYYDWAVLEVIKGNFRKAKELWQKAYEFSRQYQIHRIETVLETERFAPRFFQLLHLIDTLEARTLLSELTEKSELFRSFAGKEKFLNTGRGQIPLPALRCQLAVSN